MTVSDSERGVKRPTDRRSPQIWIPFVNHLSHCFSLRTVIIELIITQTTIVMIIPEDIELKTTISMTPNVRVVITTQEIGVEAKTAEIEIAIETRLPALAMCPQPVVAPTLTPIVTTMKTTMKSMIRRMTGLSPTIGLTIKGIKEKKYRIIHL